MLYTSGIICMQFTMYKNRSRGFTLIELLVVIAIIGILSSVVLASLNTARFRGNDAAIQSDLFSIKTQAEIFYGGMGNNGYNPNAAIANGDCKLSSSMFVVDTTIAKALVGADNANGGGAIACNASVTAYAVSAALSSEPSNYWCVDSTGNSSKSASVLNLSTMCP